MGVLPRGVAAGKMVKYPWYVAQDVDVPINCENMEEVRGTLQNGRSVNMHSADYYSILESDG